MMRLHRVDRLRVSVACATLSLFIGAWANGQADLFVTEVEVAFAVQPADALVADEEQPAADRGVPEDAKSAEQEEDAPEDPQVRAVMKQVRPPFEALLDGRLHAIRDVCQPTPIQEQALLDHGKRGMEAALREFARHTVKQNHGGFVVGFGNQQPKHITPEISMDRVMAAAVAEHLDAEQQASYQKEADERVANRRRICAAAMTTALDTELMFTEEQRQELAEKLQANWNDRWDGCEKSLVYGPRYLPKIPDNLILPMLDKQQTQLWRKTARHSSMIHMGELRLIGGDANCRIAPFKVRQAENPPPVPTEQTQ